MAIEAINQEATAVSTLRRLENLKAAMNEHKRQLYTTRNNPEQTGYDLRKLNQLRFNLIHQHPQKDAVIQVIEDGKPVHKP